MTQNLDYVYDEYLKSHQEEIAGAIPHFNERLQKTSFRYGRFTIPTFYKPYLLTPKQENLLKRVSSTLTQVINTAVRLYFEEAHLAHVFKLSPEAAELIKIDPGYSHSVVFARFDALLQ